MPAAPEPARLPDWEAFYRDYRKPGYVAGFEITSKLGGGMFGQVYRARKISIGKDYAIKFLQVEDGEVARAVLAELSQVQFFAQLDHPNLVSIEDRGEVDGIPYLVMSFAGTQTLRDVLPGAPPQGEQKAELLRYFVQACRGVAALHERSLVHFDLKPANVFLKGGVARVGDYGLSKLVTHSRGSLSMGRGTPYYMAPELLQRRGDAKSDVYSLGVMLYELLCGKVPFTGDSEWAVLKQHEQAVPEWPSHLTAVERAVMARCLQKDPAARFPSVHDLIAALGAPVAELAPAAAAAHGAAPVCLPPVAPLARPAAAAAPTAATAAKPRRRGLPRTPMFAAALLAGAALLPWSRQPSRATAAAAGDWRSAVVGPRFAPPPPAPPVPPVASGPFAALPQVAAAAELQTLLAELQRDLRSTSRSRERRLQRLAAGPCELPPDFANYLELVDALADQPEFSPGHAQKLEPLGRPVFLAAVERLQRLDYSAARDCRRAAHLQALLARLSGIGGLAEPAPSGSPDARLRLRFVGCAEAWRRLAERYAVDDAGYRGLLELQGRLVGRSSR